MESQSPLKVSRCLKVFYAWQVIMFQQQKNHKKKISDLLESTTVIQKLMNKFEAP